MDDYRLPTAVIYTPSPPMGPGWRYPFNCQALGLSRRGGADRCLGRCGYKSIEGNQMTASLAVMAWNLKKWREISDEAIMSDTQNNGSGKS
jgi:hypothetical protein